MSAFFECQQQHSTLTVVFEGGSVFIQSPAFFAGGECKTVLKCHEFHNNFISVTKLEEKLSKKCEVVQFYDLALRLGWVLQKKQQKRITFWKQVPPARFVNLVGRSVIARLGDDDSSLVGAYHTCLKIEKKIPHYLLWKFHMKAHDVIPRHISQKLCIVIRSFKSRHEWIVMFDRLVATRLLD